MVWGLLARALSTVLTVRLLSEEHQKALNVFKQRNKNWQQPGQCGSVAVLTQDPNRGPQTF